MHHPHGRRQRQTSLQLYPNLISSPTTGWNRLRPSRSSFTSVQDRSEMMLRLSACACAVAAFVAVGGVGTAWSQTTPTGLHKAEDESVMVQSLGVTIDQLEDMDIYGPNGEEIGEVDEVLVDGSAQP